MQKPKTLLSRFNDHGVTIQDNRYFKIYQFIIENPATKEELFYESHHIIPKSFGGSNDEDNLVRVSVKQHYMLHRCLPRFLSGEHKMKMAFALMWFKKKTHIGASVIEHIRTDASLALIGRTHYTNKETGQIIFVKDKPDSDQWVKGCDHGKLQFYNELTGECAFRETLPEEPGWRRGWTPSTQKGNSWWYCPMTEKYFFSFDKPTEYAVYGSPVTGTKHYINEKGEIKRFNPDDIEDGFISYHPNYNKIVATSPDGEIRFFESIEFIPSGWVKGNPSISEMLTGRIKATEKETNILRFIDKENFDPEIHIMGDLNKRGKVFVHNHIETILVNPDDIPEGWLRGWDDNRITVKDRTHYHDPITKQIRVSMDDLTEQGFVLGRGTDGETTWINNGKDNRLVKTEDPIPDGWSQGRLFKADLMTGKIHIYNPITKERKTIEDINDLPDGWVQGLLKNSNPTNKGKKTWRNLDTGKLEFFEEGIVPVGNYIKGVKRVTTEPII